MTAETAMDEIQDTMRALEPIVQTLQALVPSHESTKTTSGHPHTYTAIRG